MTTLFVDFETRSPVDLKSAGVHVYAADANTDIWCMAYAFDDEPVYLWRPGLPIPVEVARHVAAGRPLSAWNAAFERIIWRDILGPRYGFPIPKTEQWFCSMVCAYAMGLPGSLDQAGVALGTEHQKDAQGASLMLRMARPRRQDPDGTYVWWNDEERRERLYAYCRQDVETERAIRQHLVPLSAAEHELWCLDQEINDRGFAVDVDLCRASLHIIETETRRLNASTSKVTQGQVSKASEVAKLVNWLAAKGIQTDSVAKAELTDLLNRDDLPADVRDALEIRREAAKSSTAKVKALLNGVGKDHRFRGSIQFHGASTGRDAARRAQIQNFPRSSKSYNPKIAVPLILSRDIPSIHLFCGEGMSTISDALRSHITCAPGTRLLAADFSNIEGRVLAWLAGEDAKLEVFRANDAGTGPDPYLIAAARIYGKEVKKDDPERQVGKVAELALGFNGGVGAFQKMASVYGVKIPDEEAEIIKKNWRELHPNIVQWWKDLVQAAIAAVKAPGSTHHAGRIKFRRLGDHLWMRLPSGRNLCYPFCAIKSTLMPWLDREGYPVHKPMVHYWGVDGYTRKWQEQIFSPMVAAENPTQAVARDVMMDALRRLTAAGYPNILRVHDELVAEVPDGFGSLDDYCRIMAEPPEWAPDLPIAVAGWEGQRYKK